MTYKDKASYDFTPPCKTLYYSLSGQKRNEKEDTYMLIYACIYMRVYIYIFVRVYIYIFMRVTIYIYIYIT